MRPRERRETGGQDLFRSRLDQIIDMNHPLVRLARTVDWRFLEGRFGEVYTDDPGHPPLPTRLMAGLAILKLPNCGGQLGNRASLPLLSRCGCGMITSRWKYSYLVGFCFPGRHCGQLSRSQRRGVVHHCGDHIPFAWHSICFGSTEFETRGTPKRVGKARAATAACEHWREKHSCQCRSHSPALRTRWCLCRCSLSGHAGRVD
jgi:hypothetical protein